MAVVQMCALLFFFFKQKTAYEIKECDWSSDVCSSDLLSHGLVERIDSLVNLDIYANRSDVIRDAVRRFVWEKEVGSILNKGDSVKQVREARKTLSKQKIDLNKINKL